MPSLVCPRMDAVIVMLILWRNMGYNIDVLMEMLSWVDEIHIGSESLAVQCLVWQLE